MEKSEKSALVKIALLAADRLEKRILRVGPRPAPKHCCGGKLLCHFPRTATQCTAPMHCAAATYRNSSL